MPKIVVCPDSFKGSISAAQATKCIAETLREIIPEIEVLEIPLADGGEGTSGLVLDFYPVKHLIYAKDPLNRKIQACYHTDSTKRKAFIESAEFIGLPLLGQKERNPVLTTSFGLGQAISHAIDQGVEDITISLGGSATNDAGTGMLEAMGFSLQDLNGRLLPGTGENLLKIRTILPPEEFESLSRVKFTVVCDVENPLFGPDGAAYVFAPQKGASESDLPALEQGLRNFYEVSCQSGFCKKDTAYEKGMGAAGGIAFSLKTFLRGRIIKGIDYVLNHLDFERKLEGADLIITGEGRLDRQSLMGKVVSGVLERSAIKGIPVIALAGKIEDADVLRSSGLSELIEIADPAKSLEENMRPDVTLFNIRNAIINRFLRFGYR